MAFSSETYLPDRWSEEIYYGFYGADGDINEAIEPGVRFRFQFAQFHVHPEFSGNNYLVLYVSSVLGSDFDYLLYSAKVSGSSEIISATCCRSFLSGDRIRVLLSITSGGNDVGIQLGLWTIRG